MLPYTSILGMDEFRMRLQLKASFHICKNCVWAYELERLFILPCYTILVWKNCVALHVAGAPTS